jgi:hypothetical protein
MIPSLALNAALGSAYGPLNSVPAAYARVETSARVRPLPLAYSAPPDDPCWRWLKKSQPSPMPTIAAGIGFSRIVFVNVRRVSFTRSTA